MLELISSENLQASNVIFFNFFHVLSNAQWTNKNIKTYQGSEVEEMLTTCKVSRENWNSTIRTWKS